MGAGKGPIVNQLEPAPKARRVRKPAAPRRSTYTGPPVREISKLVQLYLNTVRMQPKSDYIGIFRQIQLMVAKGVTLADIFHAIEHYKANDFVRRCPQQRRHGIRRFMRPDTITQWAATAPAVDNSLAALSRLTANWIAAGAVPTPVPITPHIIEEEEEDDDWELRP